MDVLARMAAVLDCLGDELALSPGGRPSWLGLVPAQQVIMDFCGELGCSMGYVRLDGSYPSTRFPLTDVSDAACNAPRAVRLDIGVYRCLPTTAPTETESGDAVAIQLGDSDAMLRTIACCPEIGRRYLLGSYTPVGPNGGCGGGRWTVTIPDLTGAPA